MRHNFESYMSPSGEARERLAIVSVVITLHLCAFVSWRLRADMPDVRVSEMSVSFANLQMPQDDVMPQPRPKPREVEHDTQPAEKPAEKEEVVSVPQNATPRSQVVLDTDPDYRADYLNNPRPPYPMAARRMGWQGKVVLNVEVLSEGKAGQVLLSASSGYELLDHAALQTVKTWRFTPAHRAGQPVTQWFLVPIKFSLENKET